MVKGVHREGKTGNTTREKIRTGEKGEHASDEVKKKRKVQGQETVRTKRNKEREKTD